MSEPKQESPYRFLLMSVGWTSVGVFFFGFQTGNAWASAVAVIALCAMGYGIARLIASKL
jgi:hypothetical protein